MEETTRFTAEFCDKTVVGFCRFTPASLAALAVDLALSITPAGLAFCQQYFTNTERRDPTVGELRLISALAARQHRLPASVAFTKLCFEDTADARIWQDICRMKEALAPAKAPDLAAVMTATTDYLARAGHCPTQPLFCGENAVVAAKATDAALILTLGEISAVLGAKARTVAPAAGQIILALREEAETPLSLVVTRFFDSFTGLSPLPIAYIGTEGLAAHLATLPMGADIDVMQLPHYDAARGVPALLDACRNTLIVAVNASLAGQIMAAGMPVALLGKLTAAPRVTVRDGIRPLLSLTREFLAAWQSTKQVSLQLPRRAKSRIAAPVAMTANDTHMLLGVDATQAPERALSDLLLSAHRAGADFKSAALATVLTIPQSATNEALAAALSALLPLHRFSAELALSSAAVRVVTGESQAAPTLTVFLAADKNSTEQNAQTDEEHADLAKALTAGDFATARARIYPKAGHA